MDLRQLRSLVRVVELKSLNSAAEVLHIAPSALGVQVRQLEDELGVALLLRHARGVSPTPAGEVLVDHARAILAAVDVAAQRTRQAGTAAQASGHVSIGLTPPINDFISVPLLQGLKAAHPALRVAIVEAPGLSLSALVQRGELDLACTYDVGSEQDVVAEPLLEDDFVFVQRAANRGEAVDATTMTFEAATRHPLVLPAASHGSRTILDKEAKRRGLRLNVAFEVQSLVAVRELALSGQAAAIVPFASMVRHVDDPRLSIRWLVEPRVSRPLWLIRSRGTASCPPAGRVAIEAVASTFTDLLFRELGQARSALPSVPDGATRSPNGQTSRP